MYFVVTNCTVNELKKKSDEYKGAYLFAKRMQRAKCDHNNAINSVECIRSVIKETNPDKYCVATQNESLQSSLRCLSGVPVIYLFHNKCFLDIPKATQEITKEIIHKKTSIPEEEKKRLEKVIGSIEEEESILSSDKKTKKRKKKGPNPLSVKKKQKIESPPKPIEDDSKKKKVRRKKKKTVKNEDKQSVPEIVVS